MIRIVCFLACCLLNSSFVIAQIKPAYPFGQLPGQSVFALKTDSVGHSLPCGTEAKGPLPVISDEELNRFRQKSVTAYCVKVMLTVFANDDGTNLASSDFHQLRQFDAMVAQYAPHDICFVLIGIRHINNTDLNDQDAETEESELNPFRVAGVFNMFTHRRVTDGTKIENGVPVPVVVGGTAYRIPNAGAYASLSKGNVENWDDISTMSHEVGHTFGLIHTFEPVIGLENVVRSGACANCTMTGDLLCDTPADPDQSDSGYLWANTTSQATGCLYSGTRVDNCTPSVPFTPSTTNIMSYGRRECRNRYTAGQGERMRYYLANTSAFSAILASPTVSLLPAAYTNITHFEAARDVLTIAALSYQVLLTANLSLYAKRIELKPGVRFSPGAGGRVRVIVNPYCQ